MGFKTFLQSLTEKSKPESTESPYTDFRRVTKTRRVRARGREREEGGRSGND